MNLFQTLLTLPTDASPKDRIVAAVTDIAMRHRANGVATQGWSLCELCQDADDYTCLYVLIAAIPCAVAQAFLVTKSDWQLGATFGGREITLRGGIGILLLLLCVEAARRDAHEDALWPHASRAFDITEWGELLFSGGQPTEIFKETICTAAREWNLRHVFDRMDAGEPMQWYFQTVKMQYGISGVVGKSERFAKHLQWGGGSDAVRALLAKSKGFAGFFRTMQGVRSGRIDRIEMESRLRQYGAWVPPNCTLDQLHKAARVRVAGKVDVSGVDVKEEPSSLVKAVELKWSGLQDELPRLCLDLEPALLNALLEISARLELGGKRVASLSRQADNTLLPLPYSDFSGDSPYNLRVPFTSGAAEVTIAVVVSGTDEAVDAVIHAETILLRDAHTEVSSCDGGGARFIPGVSALCWLNEGLELRFDSKTGAMAMWQFANDTMLCRLPQGWRGGLCAVFPEWETEPIWENPAVHPPIPPQPLRPAWAVGCDAKLQTHPTNPAHVGVWVTLAPGVTVRRVRFGGKSFAQEAQGGVWGGVDAATLKDFVPVDVWLVHESGETHRLEKENCYVPREGIFARNGADGWKLCDSQKTVSVRSVTENPWRVFVPQVWWDKNAIPTRVHLFEGSRLLGAVATGRPRGAAIFESPSGWGMPVWIRSHRFNNIHAPLVFAKGVCDHGVLGKIECAGTTLTLSLLKRLPTTDAVRVHLFDTNGVETVRLPEAITTIDDKTWQVETGSENECLVVAVSHNGYRIGARSLPGFVEALRNGWGGEANAPRIAASLRWLKLPLLLESWRNAAREWRDAVGCKAVCAWIQNTDLPLHLTFTSEDGWDGARRALLHDWEPTVGDVGRLLNLLAPKRTESQLGAAFAALLDISPQMAVAVWRATRWNAALPGAPSAQGVRDALLNVLSKRFEHTLTDRSAVQTLLVVVGRRLGGEEHPLADAFLNQLLNAEPKEVVAQNRDCALESCAELRAALFLRGTAS